MYKNILWFLIIMLSGCKPAQHVTELNGEAYGSSYHIKMVLNNTSTSLEEVRREVAITLSEIDAQLSTIRDDSEILRINGLERTTWLLVPKEIVELLTIAQTVYEHSGGCYDVTIASLQDLWRFSLHENRVPSQEEIDAILPHVGMPLLEIDVVNQRIRKKDPKVKIDLSSIAQGYSVGVIAHLLEAKGIHNYLVEIGGEIIVKGHKANGDDWRIGLQPSNPFPRDIQKIIDAREQSGIAIMTEGSNQNFAEEKGQANAPVLNPKTGRPITHKLRSVTVMHKDPVLADAWDTALLCMGEQEAIRIADLEQLKVVLVYNEDNKLSEHLSKAFTAE